MTGTAYFQTSPFLPTAKFFVILLALHFSTAHAITVSDVRVSITADSAGAAREQAIKQAHTIAFQKLMQENFLGQEMPPGINF